MHHAHSLQQELHGTTILSIRDQDSVVIIGDGQVSLGNTVMKGNAKKVRRTSNGKVIVGFAGSTADAFTLFDKFESKLEEHRDNLTRAAVELAKDWRSNKMLRNLEAMLCAADSRSSLIISGNGDVIEPEDGIMAIGSGGQFALAAARGLKHSNDRKPSSAMNAGELATAAMQIAADICVYTNTNFTLEEIKND